LLRINDKGEKLEKYTQPEFLSKLGMNPAEYKKWLYGRAASQHTRDKKYCLKMGIPFARERKDYRKSIHDAVEKSKGNDSYTGKSMNWKDKYEGKKIPDLPTVDHVDRQNFDGEPKFVICSWEVNDMKNDLSYKDFRELCKKILEYKAGQNE
jgi:transcriptional regulator with XRE-family HTH domain